MHLIHLGTIDSRLWVDLTTEGLEPYRDSLHLFVDASILLTLLPQISSDPYVSAMFLFPWNFDHG